MESAKTETICAPATVSVQEAAQIAGRSVTWIRRQRLFGPLEPAEMNGQQAVTVASLRALMRQTRKRPELRLIVNNT